MDESGRDKALRHFDRRCNERLGFTFERDQLDWIRKICRKRKTILFRRDPWNLREWWLFAIEGNIWMFLWDPSLRSLVTLWLEATSCVLSSNPTDFYSHK